MLLTEEMRRNEKKPPGVTSYDLSESSEKIANSTFKDHEEFLEDNGFIKRIERPSNKKNERDTFPYTITNLGIFSLLQHRLTLKSAKTILLSDFKDFVPYINNHWEELRRIYQEEDILWGAMRRALRSIDVRPMFDLVESEILRLRDETISFSFGDRKFSKTITYNIYTDEEIEQLQNSKKILLEESYALQYANINEIQNNIQDKITFLFYLTLLGYGSLEKNKKVDELVASEMQLEVIKMITKGRDVSRKGAKIFPEVVKIIKSDSGLLNIFEKNLSELIDLISVPDSLKHISSKFRT